MAVFRYYILDGDSRVIAGDYLDSNDLRSAIAAIRAAACNLAPNHGHGFEVWQAATLLHREAVADDDLARSRREPAQA